VFYVESFSGSPVINIAYTDRYDTFLEEKGLFGGDFARGACKYLGVELPALPGNPNRFERYTVSRTGEYVFPLIQGQERFVSIRQTEKNSSVKIKYFYIYYTSALYDYRNSFSCSSDKLTRLWYISAYTLELATIKSDLWDSLNGKLLLRRLTHGSPAGIHNGFRSLKNYSYDIDFSLSFNPDASSGIGILVRAENRNSGYVFDIRLDGQVTTYKREERKDIFLKRVQIPPLTDNAVYTAKAVCEGGAVTLYLADKEIMRIDGAAYTAGSFGFCQRKECYAVVYGISVSDGSGKLYESKGDFREDFEFDVSPFFISDGAKRDRLPWSGDLDWAFRSGFYAFSEQTAMADSLRILCRGQNEEGYIAGVCYPEARDKPRAGEYGHYESDMFSAWVAVAYLQYIRFGGDNGFAAELYPAIARALKYFLQYTEADGLFNQRYETSKGLWDHTLGDSGKNTYTNLMMQYCFANISGISKRLGHPEDAALFGGAAQRMKTAIHSLLWSDKAGGFVKSLVKREFCDMANPMALYLRFATAGQAAVIAGAERPAHAYGKIITLVVNGLYDYGYGKKAFEMLTGKTPLQTAPETEACSHVDWMGVAGHPDFCNTLTECMHFPPMNFGTLNNWGDASHPDSGICDVLSGKILGIRPAAPGFKEVLIKPCLYGLKYARGRLVTKYGSIELSVREVEGGYDVDCAVTGSVAYSFDFSGLKGKIFINKKEGAA
jgi:alpha-L-rhamnosidase